MSVEEVRKEENLPPNCFSVNYLISSIHRKMKELQIMGHFKRDKLTKTFYLLLSKSNKCFEVAQMILDGIALDPEKNYELIPPSHKGSNEI